MKSNLYEEMQTRIALRKFDRFCLRAACVCVVLATIGFGFLIAANLAIVLAN